MELLILFWSFVNANNLRPLRRGNEWIRKACVEFKEPSEGEIVSRALQRHPGHENFVSRKIRGKDSKL